MSAAIWRTSRFAIDLARPRVMGIVNVTPDSFSERGTGPTTTQAIARCEQMLAEGADILDIGGESSRPGALPVSVEEELARVRPVLAAAVGLGVPVSIDTTKVEVMRVALDLGVDIVNDIGGLRTPGALELVAAHPACGVCLMHMRGTPRSMQAEAVYHDVVAEVVAFLRERIDAADAAGIGHERIVADPGIGFGKTPAQNLELLAHQDVLLTLGVPILVGWSRKSTLARLAGLAATAPAGRSTAARARLESASVVAAVLAVQRGACVVRVHDVAATVAGLAVWQAAHDADNRADLSSDRASIP
jgi:dihydropteroate synthase